MTDDQNVKDQSVDTANETNSPDVSPKKRHRKTKPLSKTKQYKRDYQRAFYQRHKEKISIKHKEKYATNAEYRKECIERARKRYDRIRRLSNPFLRME